MNSKPFNIDAVEELLKNSKQLQNKIRQELRLQVIQSPVVAELKKQELPPVWDNAMLALYKDSIVADYLQDKPNLPIKQNKCISARSEAAGPKGNIPKMPQKSNSNVELRDSLLSFRKNRSSTSVKAQFGEKSKRKLISQDRVQPKSIKTPKLNKSSTHGSRINLESNKLVATSSYRLPLQRFAESSNKNIDFFEEHPDLELDMASEQTTLFPRRFHRPTECLSQNAECVNLVEAEMKPPEPTPTLLKQDTWNGILMQNKANVKPTIKIVRPKKTKEVVSESPDLVTPSKIKEPDECYDLIASIPSKGIFTLQKPSERLAKQKKCHLQRFPVLYIRPECKVQKVANISIRGESVNISKSTTAGNTTSNVKYFEFMHEDNFGEKSLDLKIVPDEVGIDVIEKDVNNESNAMKENKFFKALEFQNLYECSTTNSVSSPFTHQLSSTNRSLSSLSSSSSFKNVNTSTSVDEIGHNLRSPSKTLLRSKITKNSVKSNPSRREAHVQTENDFKEMVSKNTSPLHNPVQSSSQLTQVTTMVNINDKLNKIARLHKVENPVEDDIIAKIFERIRNDLPDALEVYKNRNAPTAIGSTTILPISPADKEHNQEQKNQKHQNQTLSSNNESNEIDPSIRCVQEKGQEEDNHIETISQMIPIDCYNNSPTSTPGVHRNDFLQHNSLFVQTINKSSAVHGAQISRNRESHEYPTDKEIKRAVKIFIDSLTLDGCDGEKKAIINDISTKRRSVIVSRSELINSKLNSRLNKYTSSDSSNISNSLNRMYKMKINSSRMRNKVRWGDISGSSTSTDLESDLESEIDVTNKMQNLSVHDINDTSYMSEGEIKSIGEI